MLRLNVNCSLIHNPRKINLGSTYRSWKIKFYQARKSYARVSVKALRNEKDGGRSSFRGQSWDPGMEIAVPFEQRPVNEYTSLKDGFLYSWGELEPGQLFLRLGGLWLVTFTVFGVPISAASFSPEKETLRFVLAAGAGTLLLVSLITLRIYLVLARDRLLGSYKVKPVIKLLKQTLVGTGALLVTAGLLFIFATPVEDFFLNHSGTRDDSSNINTKYRKEKLLNLPAEVRTDDSLAAAAAEAADGRPVYCRDRYYRALAGGQYCKWEDLLSK
ncbi:protein CONSERVED IN THE GREEN LINEAGE AND DIATOMS 27, chloroplastic isoform X2 [Mercurialis annua]|uniref:protein CONSERVED IN THE GREEN LINEAGE AND DIATOMS 27, chloroplastic isoform X2 n=1 Tax=Mercurialis annua TaxID=3986 RepID=UPI002160E77C|nr:protein CONSERVED IN THE GREEN LINEAGE AND DIATOMS 27, chloroplastic isoform X2 [Mercurialis annua]